MFSGFPPRLRASVRFTLTSAWLCVAAGGLSSIAFNSQGLFTDLTGAAIVVTAVLAAYGAACNRYRWEWVSAWFASASMTPHIVFAWAQVLEHGPSRMDSAWLLTALAAFFALRAQMCAAHASKLRSTTKPRGGDDG
jgi:hypothetical protein